MIDGRREASAHTAPSDRLAREHENERSAHHAEGSRLHSLRVEAIDAGSASDVGLSRNCNQDRCIQAANSAGHHLFLVADGMGGHQGGEVAAQIVADTCRELLISAGKSSVEDLCAYMLRESNRRIRARSESDPRLQGMGSTGTVLVVTPRGQVHIAHVGDSRAYRIRAGEIQRLTTDHSVVASLVQASLIDSAEASEHPRRDELLRSLGAREELEVEVLSLTLEPGDRFVLCSDGLWSLVGDTEMLRKVNASSPAAAARALVELANLRGGLDNISVHVIEPILRSTLPPATVAPHRASLRNGFVRALIVVGLMALALRWIITTG